MPSVEGAQRTAEYGLRGARAQKIGVVDTVAPGQRRVDEAHGLHAHVARAGGSAEIYVLIKEGFETQLLSQRGRQEQAGVGHRVLIGEGY